VLTGAFISDFDLGIRDAAREHGVSTVLHDAVRDLYETATAIGYGKRDVAMVVKAFDNELTGNR